MPSSLPGRAALACVVAVLSAGFLHYLITAIPAIRFPFEIDYGEGIVWEQMHRIMAGTAYGRIDGFPAIAFPYPPLYYVASALLAQLTGMDELAAARLLSVVSALAIVGFVAGIVREIAPSPAELPAYRRIGWLAGLMALGTQPVLIWSVLMRVDMLFVALSFAGLYFGMRALTRPKEIYLAALLFVAAIFTKQIAIAAPCAVFGVMLFLRPRTAWAGIATCLVVGLAALAPIMVQTGGGFLRHILTYTINQFRPVQVLDLLEAFGVHIVYCVLAGSTIHRRWRGLPGARGPRDWRTLRRHLTGHPADAGFAIAVVYLLLATLMLITALKSGSSINYFLEWGCLIALFAGLALVDTLSPPATGVVTGPGHRRSMAFAPWAIAVQAALLFGLVGNGHAEKAIHGADMARLAELVRAAPAPVISDDMVAVIRGGKAVQWEPFIFAELATKGTWDERPFVDLIIARRFAFFVTEGHPGDRDLYDERYTPAVSAAIQAAYPTERTLAGYTLHFPPGPLPAYAGDLKRGYRPSAGVRLAALHRGLPAKSSSANRAGLAWNKA